MIDVATGTDGVVVRAEISAPRELVWRSLTEEERIAEWWRGHVSLEAPWPRGRSWGLSVGSPFVLSLGVCCYEAFHTQLSGPFTRVAGQRASFGPAERTYLFRRSKGIGAGVLSI